MIKHFCDHCGKAIDELDNRVCINMHIRMGLPHKEFDFEYHKECVDKIFGDGFSKKLIEEDAQERKLREEKRAKKLKEIEEKEHKHENYINQN